MNIHEYQAKSLLGKFGVAVPRGGVVVRDIAGVTVTEVVRLVKPNLDARPDRGAYA